MAHPTLVYSHNTNPSRALAATGLFPPVRLILALPHIWVPGVLMVVAHFASYVGYWYVAITGTYPGAIHRFIQTTLRWAVRSWAWTLGLTDFYPPFETDPEFPIDLPLPLPERPDRRWAVAGILVLPKTLIILPHLIAGMFLGVAAAVAAWIGFWATVFTGRTPPGIQDFVAGSIQWMMRSLAWFAGLSDAYPPFSVEADPV